MSRRNNHQTTGTRLRRERSNRGWTQVDLAERAQILQVDVSRIELGRNQPRNDTIDRLARAFDVPSWEIYRWLREPYSPAVEDHEEEVARAS